jgi:hypothetical protein
MSLPTFLPGIQGEAVFSSTGDPIRPVQAKTSVAGPVIASRGPHVQRFSSGRAWAQSIGESLFAVLFPSDCRICGETLVRISRGTPCTTGATVSECARVLRRAGATKVWVATVARTLKITADVLVLNASYEPINVCAARRAIVLVLKGVAMTEEENGHFLHAARVAMRVPSVIRLLEYRRIPHQSRALSRKNILLRDRNTCQYCSTTLRRRASLRSTTSFRARAAGSPPGRTWSPAATPATAAKATSYRMKPT